MPEERSNVLVCPSTLEGRTSGGFVQVRTVFQTLKPLAFPPGDGRMVKIVLNCPVSETVSLLAQLLEDSL